MKEPSDDEAMERRTPAKGAQRLHGGVVGRSQSARAVGVYGEAGARRRATTTRQTALGDAASVRVALAETADDGFVSRDVKDLVALIVSVVPVVRKDAAQIALAAAPVTAVAAARRDAVRVILGMRKRVAASFARLADASDVDVSAVGALARRRRRALRMVRHVSRLAAQGKERADAFSSVRRTPSLFFKSSRAQTDPDASNDAKSAGDPDDARSSIRGLSFCFLESNPRGSRR